MVLDKFDLLRAIEGLGVEWATLIRLKVSLVFYYLGLLVVCLGGFSM